MRYLLQPTKNGGRRKKTPFSRTIFTGGKPTRMLNSGISLKRLKKLSGALDMKPDIILTIMADLAEGQTINLERFRM